MRFTAEDVGNYVLDNTGTLYKVIWYSGHPQVGLEMVEGNTCEHCGNKYTKSFSAECLLADEYVRLVKEKNDDS